MISQESEILRELAEARKRTRFDLLRDFLRKFRRNRAALFGLLILFGFVLSAVFADFYPHNPVKQDLSKTLRPPSAEHPLGTDQLGRDVLARILHGSRISLLVGLAAVSFGAVIGVVLGLLSGYFSRWSDMVIQRVTDVLLSFPTFLLALSLVAMLGVGLQNVTISVGVTAIPVFTRLVRASVLTIREMHYVEAAKALQLPSYVIMFKHILPNALSPVIVQATLYMGTAILVAAGLGFLGVGVQPPTPEWGQMLGEYYLYIFSQQHLVLAPGLAIFLTVLSFNLIGDGLRDALDPRMRLL
ncbi:MAG: ABC transporter permease [Candidatus Caldarchaeum sp.]|nr:ABC transporter permease [Candidatus Caldarchaeum sp.]MCX8201624.1 ABC transporter permease [Candidatus Caldarchaeum sp.]MDW8436338.1 ABC transporter permease [Candidatus Caldarchaeum sp.]